MNDYPVAAIRALAVKIATSYTRANPMPVESLPGVIQSAYHGLMRCVLPPEPPPPPKKARRRAQR